MEVNNTPENRMCIQKSGKFRLNQRVVLNCEEMVSLNESNRSDADLDVHNLSITPDVVPTKDNKVPCTETKSAMMVCMEQNPSTTKRLKTIGKKLQTPKRKNVQKSIKRLKF